VILNKLKNFGVGVVELGSGVVSKNSVMSE